MAYKTIKEKKHTKKLRARFVAIYAMVAILVATMAFVSGCSQKQTPTLPSLMPSFTIYEHIDVNYTNPTVDIILRSTKGQTDVNKTKR